MLRRLPPQTDPNLLVGTNTSDDAGVYRLSADLALVQTVDFFTPVVDDPYWFGAIAAANALSDVYAMGGTPLTALNLVGFPMDTLPLDVLFEILRGGGDKAREAGVAIVGGHTVDDPEPKFGLSVTGTIHPDRIITNAGGRDGDVLVLTKPLGSGIATTAIKRDIAPAGLTEEVIAVMAMLNRVAGEAMATVRAHAATDVTGFGFLGHLGEMAAGAGLQAVVYAGAVPLLPGVLDLAAQGVVPGGSKRNLESLDGRLTVDEGVSDALRLVLGDAQTSGGLLIAVLPHEVEKLQTELRARGALAAVVGRLQAGAPGRLHVAAGATA